jgi:uncharacterized membrane protein YfcA
VLALLAADPHAAALAVAGLVAGIAIGLTGMGGGVVLTPIMVVGLGVPANVAVGNDLMVSLLVKPIGAAAHQRAGTVRTDIVRWLVVGSVPAAFAGAAIVGLWLDGNGDTLETIIGATLLVSAVAMTIRMFVATKGAGASLVRPLPTVAVGIIGGVLVGITSVGSGSLMLVLMTWVYPYLSGRELVGTDLAQAIPLVAAATLGHLIFGDIRFGIVLPVLVGAAPGVWLGSRWSTRMSNRILRPLLIVLVGASGLRLVGAI